MKFGALRIALWLPLRTLPSPGLNQPSPTACGPRPRPSRPVITEGARGQGGTSENLQPSLCVPHYPLGPPPSITASRSRLESEHRREASGRRGGESRGSEIGGG